MAYAVGQTSGAAGLHPYAPALQERQSDDPMGDATRAKINSFIHTYDRRYGKCERPLPLPPASSADAAAVATVSAKNAQIVASVVLGLHGPPSEGADAAKKLMAYFVDWNEVRVSRPQTLVSVLGRTPRSAQRVQTLQRFLESYFLRQRSMNPDYLFTLKPAESRRFLADLEVFDREELAAVLLTGFGQGFFPPAEPLMEMATAAGLLKPKTTALQMEKKFETAGDEALLYSLYSHLYSLYHDAERDTLLKRKSKK
jgi:hypothetical protein